jgi:D-serine dehydratase
VDIHTLLSQDRAIHKVDFSTITKEELTDFTMEFKFKVSKTGRLRISVFSTLA